MLAPGARLGGYEITALIGTGGMGEVYRATDTKLGREVAIKVLPSHLSADAERLARFQREAQILAALNYPQIAAIYGLEEANGARFLILELVDGDTLDKRIAEGPIPVDEALGIARQIAEALEGAHDKGIIHRDLKPSNIALTTEGRVKVLDFGLAKLIPSAVARGTPMSPSMSPTITSPALVTGATVLMGTAGYMSPEQAKGREAGPRSDVWAFGCVLYEMLTGRRAFGGEEVTDVLAHVLERDPDHEALPPDTPAAVRRLLRRCLNKDIHGRLAAIADARLEIDDAIAGRGSLDGTVVITPSPQWRRWLVSGMACLASAALAGGAVWLRARPAPPRPVRYVVAPPPTAPLFSESIGSTVAVSADGRQIVYSGIADGVLQLYLRTVDQVEAHPIRGTEGGRQPFFSPDGTQVGFWATAEGQIKKVPSRGGPVSTICKAPSGNIYGASWGPDGRIVFASGGLYRVSSAGGAVEQITRPSVEEGEVDLRWPDVLPDARGVVFTRWSGSIDRARVASLSLKTGEQHVVVEGAHFARYAPSGYLVFSQNGALAAARFDVRNMQVSGDRLSAQESIRTNATGASDFSLSADGTLVFVPGTARPERRLMWVDHQGHGTRLLDAADDYWFPRLSPDGRRLAVGIGGDIWVIELGTLARTRITFESGTQFLSVYVVEKERIAFSKVESKVGLDIYSSSAMGGAQPELLVKGEYRQWATSASADGRVLALYQQHPTTLRDILTATADGTRTNFIVTPFQERAGSFSPDGRWVAYVSNESGHDEVYVQPFPFRAGARVTISVGGGTEPTWSATGREIFYRSGDRMMTVPVNAGPEMTAGRPRLLFSAAFERDRGSGGANPNYDVTPDGRGFVMIQAPTTSMNIVVALHWLAGVANGAASAQRQ